MISGISHITLSVQDLEISFSFYSKVPGFKPLAKWNEGAYFLAGGIWFCISLDTSTRSGPLAEYSHVAFAVSKADFLATAKAIVESGAVIWKENTSPGESLYFLDPDGHKLEIHVSTWQDRIKIAKDENWGDFQFFV